MMESADQDRALAAAVQRLLDEAEAAGKNPLIFTEKIDPVTGEVRAEPISAKAALLPAIPMPEKPGHADGMPHRLASSRRHRPEVS